MEAGTRAWPYVHTMHAFSHKSAPGPSPEMASICGGCKEEILIGKILLNSVTNFIYIALYRI